MVLEIWSATDRIFCHSEMPFLPTPQNQNFDKNEKKRMKMSLFYTSAPKIMIRCTVPETWCATDGRTDGRMEKVTHTSGCPT